MPILLREHLDMSVFQAALQAPPDLRRPALLRFRSLIELQEPKNHPHLVPVPKSPSAVDICQLQRE